MERVCILRYDLEANPFIRGFRVVLVKQIADSPKILNARNNLMP